MRNRSVTRPTYSTLSGVNKPIEAITRQIPTDLTYITNPFGLAVTKVKKVDGRTKRYPAILKDSEYISMLPDDWFNGLLFAVAHDPAINVEERTRRFKQSVSFIFWFNQLKAKPKTFIDYKHVMIPDAIKAIDKVRIPMKLEEVYLEPEEIYAGFDIDEVKTSHLTFPYNGFRIKYQLYFYESC